MKAQSDTLVTQDAEITTLKEAPTPEPEPSATADEIKKIREAAAEEVRLAKQAVTDATTKNAEETLSQNRTFAERQAFANIRNSAQRDLGLSESSSGLYDSMVKDVFDYEIEEDKGKFSVVFTEKGQEYAFSPEGKVPSSFQLAEAIAKAHPGNHNNGVPSGSGARSSTASSTSSGKPIQELSMAELDKSWSE